MTTASILTSFWDNLEDNHEQAVFLVLVGFLGSFAFIRMSTRIIRSESVSWWPGNVESESGLHLHHLVFGIVTMMAAGTLGFVSDGRTPFTEICALFFGVGVGLTIDEFALWVHLEDVYWAEEGRSSIDATVIATALMMLMVLGVSPVVIDSSSTEALITSIVLTLLAFACVAICFAKGRVLHGTIGVFVAPIAFYGAGRIGKPRSAWARYRYGERRPKKQSKAEERFAPSAAPSASRKPSATSSVASRARAWRPSGIKPPRQPARQEPKSAKRRNASPTPASQPARRRKTVTDG